jgi:hypothetical protein
VGIFRALSPGVRIYGETRHLAVTIPLNRNAVKPKLSTALPYCLAIAHTLLVTAVFVSIKVSHDPQAWLFFITVFVADYPASIGIRYLSDMPTVAGNGQQGAHAFQVGHDFRVDPGKVSR